MRANRPVRVLLAAPSFGAYGGIESFVFAVADALRADPRFDLRILFKRTTRFALQSAFEQACRGYPVAFCDRASAALLKHVAWADVVHAQNASPDLALAAMLLRKPLALTVHDFLPRRPMCRRWSWHLTARAASVRWYNSRAVWRSWEPRRTQQGSSRIPTISRLSRPAAGTRPRAGFLFIGRLVDSKGVDILLDAYVASGLRAAEWPLVIIGEGPLRASLEARCAQAGLAEVTFTGFVTEETKASAIASAKWIVAPSRDHEGLGLTVIEGRDAGVPAIVSRHGGLPEAAGRDALLCEPGDVASLAAALRTAASMPESEYAERAARTRRDLADEIVPASFYPDAYLRLLKRNPVPAMRLPDAVS